MSFIVDYAKDYQKIHMQNKFETDAAARETQRLLKEQEKTIKQLQAMVSKLIQQQSQMARQLNICKEEQRSANQEIHRLQQVLRRM